MKKKFWKVNLCKRANLYRCVCVCVCVCTHVYVCTCAHCDPQGQKSRRMRVCNNNTVGSPEQRVNMDTMEMHYAIMAGFMHFSLAGRMGREGEIKESEG